jgi:hypothetical protein
MNTNAHTNNTTRLDSAIAAGVGWSGIHTTLRYGGLLAGSFGDGVLFNESCHWMSTFVHSACLALAFNVAHVAFMLLAFDAYRHRPAALAAAAAASSSLRVQSNAGAYAVHVSEDYWALLTSLHCFACLTVLNSVAASLL